VNQKLIVQITVRISEDVSSLTYKQNIFAAVVFVKYKHKATGKEFRVGTLNPSRAKYDAACRQKEPRAYKSLTG